MGLCVWPHDPRLVQASRTELQVVSSMRVHDALRFEEEALLIRQEGHQAAAQIAVRRPP